jgi:hypothetical protein
VLAKVSSKYTITAERKAQIEALAKPTESDNAEWLEAFEGENNENH